MRARTPILSIIGILLLILAAVISPILYSGYADLHSAQTALADKKYDDAARLFELAATHLVWRNDLWEQAGLAAYRSGNNAEAIRLLEIAHDKKIAFVARLGNAWCCLLE